eukprot:s10_g38.t1
MKILLPAKITYIKSNHEWLQTSLVSLSSVVTAISTLLSFFQTQQSFVSISIYSCYVAMGPACGKSHLPEEGVKQKKTAEGDDDWKALLTSGATNDAPQRQKTEKRDTDGTEAFQALSPRSKPPTEPEAPEAPEPYGLIDEYVDDLLGIPPEERPSWQRPSWHQTGSSMDVPEMVLQDGSRALALPAAESRASQTPTPYLEGVLNGWAAIDRPVESKEVRDEPAPKRRADRPS